MPNLNKVMLIGNLTRDPEIKYTAKGTAICDLSLAINRSFKGDNGERQEETTFVDVTLWGKTAELAGQYLAKGRPVYIEGRLQLDTWQDKEGQKRSKMKVIGETMQFLGGKPGDAQEERQQSRGREAQPQRREPAKRDTMETVFTGDEDDIPF
jgi:single-strand DNA-binding protein